ncbi:acetate/propionate family kinase [candidate division KSB1 bacterium]|nr:acetate/propionate family kinase [candidate division KSB1 bacterium]
MNVFVINCGSSSLKYRLIAMPEEKEIIAGEAQRIGPKTEEPSRIVHNSGGHVDTFFVNMTNHAQAFTEVMKIIEEHQKIIPDAFGHRLVHGGSALNKDVLLNSDILAKLDETVEYAPIHNPPSIALIKACIARYPNSPQVIVLDTAFHTTLPLYAKDYAIPVWLSKKLNIKKFGFHGISHHFVAEEAAKYLGIPISRLNAVSCHLGSGGASLCAVVKGQSIDNTMGFTPLQGLVMSTRCGDVDPAVTLNLIACFEGDYKAVQSTLNKNSGILGMTGTSADIRDILAKSVLTEGYSSPYFITSHIYTWRLKKYLGAYLTIAHPVHAIIFTDTIGETVPYIRKEVCSEMDIFGVHVDDKKNSYIENYPSDISESWSPVRILVVKTNEELAIARNTYKLIKNNSGD